MQSCWTIHQWHANFSRPVECLHPRLNCPFILMAQDDVVIPSSHEAGPTVCLSESSQVLAVTIFSSTSPFSTKWSVQVIRGMLDAANRHIPLCCLATFPNKLQIFWIYPLCVKNSPSPWPHYMLNRCSLRVLFVKWHRFNIACVLFWADSTL